MELLACPSPTPATGQTEPMSLRPTPDPAACITMTWRRPAGVAAVTWAAGETGKQLDRHLTCF